jgi:hypothetical protein
MLLSPRLLYGLHERFLLFPYVYGSRHTRLVLRVSKLAGLLRANISKAAMMGAPLVLGELHSVDVFRNQDLLPRVVTGQGIHSFYHLAGVQLYLRCYRVQALYRGRSLRFEVGTKLVYATHTQYFSLELLRHLIEGGSNEEARSEAKRFPGDHVPPAS